MSLFDFLRSRSGKEASTPTPMPTAGDEGEHGEGDGGGGDGGSSGGGNGGGG